MSVFSCWSCLFVATLSMDSAVFVATLPVDPSIFVDVGLAYLQQKYHLYHRLLST